MLQITGIERVQEAVVYVNGKQVDALPQEQWEDIRLSKDFVMTYDEFSRRYDTPVKQEFEEPYSDDVRVTTVRGIVYRTVKRNDVVRFEEEVTDIEDEYTTASRWISDGLNSLFQEFNVPFHAAVEYVDSARPELYVYPSADSTDGRKVTLDINYRSATGWNVDYEVWLRDANPNFIDERACFTVADTVEGQAIGRRELKEELKKVMWVWRTVAEFLLNERKAA